MNNPDVIKAIHADSHVWQWPGPNPDINWTYGSEMAEINLLFPKFFAAAPHWKILVVSGDAGNLA